MCALVMPVLLIAGTNDSTMDSIKAAERLSQYVPQAKIRLIENGSHLIMGETGTVVPFLEEIVVNKEFPR